MLRKTKKEPDGKTHSHDGKHVGKKEVARKKARPEIKFSAEDVARAAMSAIKPILKDMAYEERRSICADLAQNLRKARFVTDIRIGFAVTDRREKEDVRELGRRIMRERNAHYKG